MSNNNSKRVPAVQAAGASEPTSQKPPVSEQDKRASRTISAATLVPLADGYLA